MIYWPYETGFCIFCLFNFRMLQIFFLFLIIDADRKETGFKMFCGFPDSVGKRRERGGNLGQSK